MFVENGLWLTKSRNPGRGADDDLSCPPGGGRRLNEQPGLGSRKGQCSASRSYRRRGSSFFAVELRFRCWMGAKMRVPALISWIGPDIIDKPHNTLDVEKGCQAQNSAESSSLRSARVYNGILHDITKMPFPMLRAVVKLTAVPPDRALPSQRPIRSLLRPPTYGGRKQNGCP
jgi:hypothetical protein